MPDEQQLIAYLEAQKAAAVGFMDDTVSAERKRLLKLYQGAKYGDEVPGQSQVVTKDIAEVVDWWVPDPVRIFASGEKAVYFQGKNEDDFAYGDQVTDVINHIFLVENEGAKIVFDWAKDGAIQKNGFVKTWWEEAKHKTRQIYTDLSVIQVAVFEDDENVEIVSQDSEPIEELQDVDLDEVLSGSSEAAALLVDLARGFPDGKKYTIEIEIETTKGQIIVEGVPPEEILYVKRSKDIEKDPYLAHRSYKPTSELVAEGLTDAETAKTLTADDSNLRQDEEPRYPGETDGRRGRRPETEETREVEVLEEYVRFDWDGDGIAELRKVIRVGRTILENEYLDEIPLVNFSPNPMPHRTTGEGLADQVEDIQRISTVVTRQTLNNLYHTNNPQKGVDINGVTDTTYDELLTPRIGGLVRVNGNPNEVLSINAVPFFGRNGFQMLEQLQLGKERRTGVTRLSQGLPDQALSDNATTTVALMAAAQTRKDLLAEIFGWSMSRLFGKMLRLLKKHQNVEKTIRLRDEFVIVDPRTWTGEFDVVVDVGLGQGGREQKQAALTQTLNEQIQAIDSGTGLANIQNVYNTAADLLRARGLPNVNRYFIDPGSSEYQPPPPQPSDAEVEAQAELEKVRIQERSKIIQTQIKAQADFQEAMAKAGINADLKLTELTLEAELEMEKAELAGTQARIDAELRSPVD